MTTSPGRGTGIGASAIFRLSMPFVSRSSYRFISAVVRQDLFAEELELLLADLERQQALIAEPSHVLRVTVFDELVHAAAYVRDRPRHQVLRFLHAVDRPLLARQHLALGIARQAERLPEPEVTPEALPEHTHRAVLAVVADFRIGADRELTEHADRLAAVELAAILQRFLL